MITGYNTEIKHRGRLFHVQTEDKGKGNPIIESLIYIGGEILDSVRNSYKDKLGENYSRDDVLKLMERQHNNVLQGIKEGHYDPEPAPGSAPVGDAYVNKEHTLDEVVLSMIAGKNKEGESEEPVVTERLELELLHGMKPEPGKNLSIEMCARTNDTGTAIPGAKVTIRLVARRVKPRVLFEGETDKDGLVCAELKIPKGKFESGALVIQASSELGYDEIRRPLS